MSARIEEIRLKNFRALEDVRLRLSDLTFLVGRNGAGKSSLLDGVEFLREAVTDSLPTALNRRDGLSGVLRKGAPPDARLGLAVVLRTEILDRTVRMLYGFELAPGRGGEMDIREALRVSSSASMGFLRVGGEFEAGDSRQGPAVPKNRLVLPLVVNDELWEIAFKALAHMRAYEISPHAVASPAPIQNATNLEKDGSNAGDVLEEVCLRPAVYESMVNTLRWVTPGVLHVRSDISLSRRIINFSQEVGGTTQQFNAGQMSQGTLRALGMLLSLYQEPAPSLVLIDEVEDSIHPRAIEALLEAIEECAPRFPVVVTTHSPEVLGKRQVIPDRVRILQWYQGISRVYPLAEGTKESVDPVTTVGDLLRFNALWPDERPEVLGGDLLELDG